MDYIPTVITKLQNVNLNKKINIRAKKGSKQKRWSLFLDYFSNGKHHFKFPKKYIIGTPQSKTEDMETLKWMQIYRDDLERRLLMGEDIFGEKKPDDAVNLLDFIVHAGKGKERLPSYQGLRKHIINFANDKINFDDLTPIFCRKFKDYLLGKVKASTARTVFSCLKATIHLAMKENIITLDPCKDIVIKAPDAQREFLLQEEIERFIQVDTPYREVRNAFLFSVFCGCRLSDIRKLTWKEVEGGILSFRQQKTKDNVTMALTPDAITIIEEQRLKHANTPLVFDLPVSKEKINNKLKSIVKAAGIKKHITMHCGRHSAACFWIAAGVPIFTVQKLLGHTDIKTTMIYAKLIDKTRDEYVQMMPVLLKNNPQ